MEKRHYEILLVFRHLQDDKTDTLIKKYQAVFTKDGELTRFENWGIRPLAYHIDGFSRALYLLFNVYGPSTAIDELEKLIKFDDMLLRHIIIRGKESITEESPILKHNKAKSSREHGSDRDASQAAFKRGPATTDVATASPEPIKPEAPAAVVSDELKEEVVVNAAEEVIGDEPTAAIQESTATDVSDTVAEATNTEENTEEAK
ncbi:MAG: 30S ribosomal protein S6 [Gammaproteobacteria bacterium]|nr:30S ribosomal protein S6 [Gammaproteobacteria bacterium]